MKRRVRILVLVMGLAMTFALAAPAGAASSPDKAPAPQSALAERAPRQFGPAPGDAAYQASAIPGAQTVTAYLTQGLRDQALVDVYIDGFLWGEDFAPGDTAWTVLPASTVTLELTIADTTTSIIAETLNLTSFGNDVVGIVSSYDFDAAGAAGFTVLDLATEPTTNQLPVGQGTLQSVHAANTAGLFVAVDGIVQSDILRSNTSTVKNYESSFYDVTFTGESGGVPTTSIETAVAPGWLTVVVVISDAGLNSTIEAFNYTVRLGTSYTLIAGDGGVFTFGDATYHGGLGGEKLNKPVIAGASTPGGLGYWLVAEDGGVFTFGNAVFHGSTGGLTLNSPVITMIATPTGNGYWLLAKDGGVFTFGDAKFFGSTGDLKLNSPIISGESTPSGNGYWLVASDGGIFTFGDAKFFGSTGDLKLNKPVIGIAAAPAGLGYFLVAEDGGVFTFGAAEFYGSAVGNVSSEVVALATSPTKRGYWVATKTGQVRNFGDATFSGDLSTTKLNAPIISIFS